MQAPDPSSADYGGLSVSSEVGIFPALLLLASVGVQVRPIPWLSELAVMDLLR